MTWRNTTSCCVGYSFLPKNGILSLYGHIQGKPLSKAKKTVSHRDPYAAREAEKYSNPIPSRECIMELLREQGQLISYSKLIEMLDLTSPEAREALSRRLKAMVRDGQLMKNRKGSYGLIAKMNLIPGRVIAHKDGFGLVKPDDGTESLFLNERQMCQVFHNDRVLVRLTGSYRRHSPEAIIVEVIERNTQRIVGRLEEIDNILYVIPRNQRIKQQILVSDVRIKSMELGKIVVIELTSQPQMNSAPTGVVIEELGGEMDPGMEIDIAIRTHNLPYEWNEAVNAETANIPARVLKTDKENRRDLREVPLVTIDGDDAKDFDDAVYCRRKKNGWQLTVAIADVAHYVTPGSALDQEAELRGNSVYFPGRVIPMLPRQLSNGLCSLNPEVDRLCMACQIDLDGEGEVTQYEFFPAVIYSHARLTYKKVAKILQENDVELIAQYKHLHNHLKDMHVLYKILHKQRKQRGAIDFDLPETQVIFGKDRKIKKIIPTERTVAHCLIEEFMLLANVCASEFLAKHKIPVLYRVHPGPDEDKLEALRLTLECFGVHLKGGKKPQPKHYQDVLQQCAGKSSVQWLQMLLLRSLDQAVYQGKNAGHFGLAYKAYTHFTSPIRRYPDLLVHRAIKYILSGKKINTFDDATRDAMDWLKCEFMLDKVGQIHSGRITGVMPFGVFVCLDEFFVDGLVHVTSLKNDYYHYDAKRQVLLGERTPTAYQLGDKVTVKVMKVSLENREIDFEMVMR
jgi:ribonuclease R